MGLIAATIESAGIPTLALTSAADITAASPTPRAALVDHPLGHTAGRPHDYAGNDALLAAALAGLESITEPGTIIDLGLRWAETDDWKDDVMAVRRDEHGNPDTHDDRRPRHDSPQYANAADARAADASHRDLDCEVCEGVDF